MSSSKARSRAVLANMNSMSTPDDTESSSSPLVTSSSSRLGPSSKRSASRTMAGRMQGKAAHANSENINTRTASSSTVTKVSSKPAGAARKVNVTESTPNAETVARDEDEDDAQGRQQSEAYLLQLTNSVCEPFRLQADIYAQRVREQGDEWITDAIAQSEKTIRQNSQNTEEHAGVGLAQLLKTPARARTRAPQESSSAALPDFGPVPLNLTRSTRPRTAPAIVDDDDDTSQVVDDSLLNSPYKPPKSTASKATLNSSMIGPSSSVRSKSTRSAKGKGKAVALSEPEDESGEMPGDDAEVKSRRTKKTTKKSKPIVLEDVDDDDLIDTYAEDEDAEVRGSSRRAAAQSAEQKRKAMDARQQQMLEDEEASQKARKDAEAAKRKQEKAEAKARAEEEARLELERAEAEAAAAAEAAEAEARARAEAEAEAAAAAEEQARLEAEAAAQAKADAEAAEAAAAAEKEKKRLEKERKAAEKKRQDEERAREKAEEQRKKREEKEAKQRQKEEEDRLKREEQERKEREKAEAEKKKKEEAERKKREEAERKKEEAEKKKREEAERKKEEAERKKKELEEKKQKEKEAEEQRRKAKLEQERREAEEAAARAVAAKMAAEKEAAEKAAAEAEETARLAAEAEAEALAAEEEASRLAAAAATAQAQAEAEAEADDEDDTGSDGDAEGSNVDDENDDFVAAGDDFEEIQLEDEDMPRELVASGSRHSLDTNVDAGSTVSVEAAEALRVVETNGATGPTSSRSSHASSQQQHRASSVARPGHIQSAKWNAGAPAGKMGWKLSSKFTFNTGEASNSTLASTSTGMATGSDATITATSPREARNGTAAAGTGSRIGTVGRSNNITQGTGIIKTGIPASTSRIASVQTAKNAIPGNLASKQRQVDTSASSIPSRKLGATTSAQANGGRTPSSNVRSIKKAVPALTKKLVGKGNNAEGNSAMGPGSAAKKRKVSPQPLAAATVSGIESSTATTSGKAKSQAPTVAVAVPQAPASPSRRGFLETAGAIGTRLLGLPSASAKALTAVPAHTQAASSQQQTQVNGTQRDTADGSTLRKVNSNDGPFSSQNDFQQMRAKPSNASTASSSKSTLVNSTQASQTKIKLKNLPNGSSGSGSAPVPVRGSSLLTAPGSQVLQQAPQFQGSQPSQASQYFSQTQVETQSQTVMVTAPSSQDIESQNMAQGPLAPRAPPPQPPVPQTPSIRTLAKRKRYNDLNLEDADISLPDIHSEYSDSDDEMTKRKRQREAEWMRGDGLNALLADQLQYDPEAVFGGFDNNSPPDIQRMLAPVRGGRPINIPRSSSANWANVQELERYAMERHARVKAAAEAAVAAAAAANGGEGSAGPSRRS
ncbi:hypothetical protein OC861_002743 [Tilletia horrida]|nr:hypothetical protein OC845_005174 [Tilletia horrida]KAK0567421.1 hypothetical protein OC861_002743 [Tilletia horrida]